MRSIPCWFARQLCRLPHTPGMKSGNGDPQLCVCIGCATAVRLSMGILDNIGKAWKCRGGDDACSRPGRRDESFACANHHFHQLAPRAVLKNLAAAPLSASACPSPLSVSAFVCCSSIKLYPGQPRDGSRSYRLDGFQVPFATSIKITSSLSNEVWMKLLVRIVSNRL